MIYQCNVSFKKLQQEKKEYPWKRPLECSGCQGKVWGHGYVLRYFNSHSGGLYLKRWRYAPSCKLILTCRPDSHWRRFQESIKRIFDTLIFRVKHRTWPPWTTRQRGGHWLRIFTSNARTHLLEKKSVVQQAILFYQNKKLIIF